MKKEFANKYEWLIVLSLIIVGVFLRFYALGEYPAGLNQDEASTGYEAWSLLNYGVDRNGYEWPVLLKSWGSGQNALYSYLAMPMIKVFGLSAFSVRALSALIGVVTLVVFWLTARRCRGSAFGLVALFLLVVNPWHVTISRWALESNLLPFFLLCGVYFTTRALDKEFMLLGAAVFFGLSLYAYGTAFIFVPLFAVAALAWLYVRRAVSMKSLIPAVLVFLVIAFPIAVCQTANMLKAGDLRMLGMSLPGLTEPRQLSTTLFGGHGALENFRGFLNILWKQSDGLPFNSLPYSGLYYIIGIPCAIIGLGASAARRRDNQQETPMLLFLAVPFIAAFIIEPNINRINMIFLPVIYFSALGIYLIMRKAGDFGFLPLIIVLLCFGVFCVEYYDEYVVTPSEYFFPGLGEAIGFAEEQNPGSVFISNYIVQPYIFVLFYAKTPPAEYLETVRFINPGGAFERVSGFGKYSFGEYWRAEGDVVILHISEQYDGVELAVFGSYRVMRINS